MTSWIDEFPCAQCGNYVEKHEHYYAGAAGKICWLCKERNLAMMEKRGVCQGEGEAPVAGGITKAAVEEAKNLPAQMAQAQAGKCCGGSCGSDPLSRMTDAVNDSVKK